MKVLWTLLKVAAALVLVTILVVALAVAFVVYFQQAPGRGW